MKAIVSYYNKSVEVKFHKYIKYDLTVKMWGVSPEDIKCLGEILPNCWEVRGDQVTIFIHDVQGLKIKLIK